MRSQNTSTASTRPSAASAGSISLADEVDVVAAASRVLGRQRMGAEEGGAHRHAVGLAEAPRHAQLLALVFEREAVAGLDLDGADAVGQQLFEPRRGLREERVFVGLARGAHRGDDAAAGLRHLFVAGARQPHRELVGALAAVDQVGVAVDQARRDEGAAAVVPRQRGVLRPARRRARRSRRMRALLDHDGGHRPAPASARRSGAQAQAGPQAVGGGRCVEGFIGCSQGSSDAAPPAARHPASTASLASPAACRPTTRPGPGARRLGRRQAASGRAGRAAGRAARRRPAALPSMHLSVGAAALAARHHVEVARGAAEQRAVDRHIAAEGKGLMRRVQPMVDAAVPASAAARRRHPAA